MTGRKTIGAGPQDSAKIITGYTGSHRGRYSSIKPGKVSRFFL